MVRNYLIKKNIDQPPITQHILDAGSCCCNDDGNYRT